MSSTSSIPTEIRTRPSVMPMALRPFAPSAAWVMVAGCEMSVSTGPRPPPGEGMLRMIGQTRIEHGLHFFVFGEKIGHNATAAVVNLHASRQRLHAAQHQPTFERRKNRSGRLLQERQLVGILLFCANHNSTQAVAVAVQELRGGVHHHVRA